MIRLERRVMGTFGTSVIRIEKHTSEVFLETHKLLQDAESWQMGAVPLHGLDRHPMTPATTGAFSCIWLWVKTNGTILG